jgi:hypothetical protein
VDFNVPEGCGGEGGLRLADFLWWTGGALLVIVGLGKATTKNIIMTELYAEILGCEEAINELPAERDKKKSNIL